MPKRREPLTGLETVQAVHGLVIARRSLEAALRILENRQGVPARELDRLIDMINTLNVVMANVEHEYGPKKVTQ